MLIVRPATDQDIDVLIDLSEQAGPGFTSLAVKPEMLKRRLEKSSKSYASNSTISPDHVYLLMLEDSDTGQVAGMSAIKAQIGIRDPFFNFRILKVAQKSEVTDRRFDMDVLVLVNEYAGATEVGSLYVSPEFRGNGAGRLISQSRYMLIASDQNRFSDQIVSELRGRVSETGHSPFWEAVGRKFFLMDFDEADNISAELDNQFILDLMPKYPIYATLLPQDAQDVIGQTHPAGRGAKELLEAEGFRYNGVVDIFDAGPSMSAPKSDIRTIKDSRILKISGASNEPQGNNIEGLISNDRFSDFRCVFQNFAFEGQDIVLAPDILSALNVSIGDTVKVWIKR